VYSGGSYGGGSYGGGSTYGGGSYGHDDHGHSSGDKYRDTHSRYDDTGHTGSHSSRWGGPKEWYNSGYQMGKRDRRAGMSC
ncbi:hypothetical protein, partial [Streptococcus pneumoniae]|uniref:hypothetical protein n=1 Tax=Streptococcus pneumoniae TaxID=1313 RepID=UPI001E4DDE6B